MNYRSCMKLIGSKSGKKKQICAIFGGCTGTCTGVYRYTPHRGQHVPVHIQHVPVHVNRMQHVPVHVQGIPVHVSPKMPECYVLCN